MVKNNRTKLLVSLIIAFVLSIGISFGFSFEKANAEDSTEVAIRTYDLYELNNSMSKRCGAGDYIGKIESPLNTSFKFKAEFSRLDITNHSVLSFYNSEYWGDNLLTLSGDKAYFGNNAWALANSVENPGNYYVSAACRIETDTEYVFEFGVKEVKSGDETVAYQYFFKVDDELILTYDDTEMKEIATGIYAQNNACGGNVNNVLTISSLLTTQELSKTYDFCELNNNLSKKFENGGYIGSIKSPLNTSYRFKAEFSKIDVINHSVLSFYNTESWGDHLLTLSGSKAYFGNNAWALANSVENPGNYYVSAACKIETGTEYVFEFGVREIKKEAETVAYQYFFKVDDNLILTYIDTEMKEIGKNMYAQNNACGGDVTNVLTISAVNDNLLFADISDTKYKVSADGQYLLLITAFKADEILADGENSYIIGYEIDGADSFDDNGKKYYESIALKTSETETASYRAENVFGSDYEGYYLIVYEIRNYDSAKQYTIRPFIKQITPSGDSGYTVDKTGYGKSYKSKVTASETV